MCPDGPATQRATVKVILWDCYYSAHKKSPVISPPNLIVLDCSWQRPVTQPEPAKSAMVKRQPVSTLGVVLPKDHEPEVADRWCL